MMKLLGGTKNTITKDTNEECMPYLETAEVISVYFKIVKNDYQHDSTVESVG